LAQKCIQATPVIVLGSGASAAHGLPGMWQLGQWLGTRVETQGLDPDEAAAWGQFCEKIKTTDLETALTAVHMPESLTNCIVDATWDLIAPADQQVFARVVRNRSELPLARLFKHLLSGTRTEIDVVTPNYDRLAEYAADAVGLCHYTGFHHGHLRLRSVERPIKAVQNGKPARTVNIWKVHGSLDWFSDPDSVIVGLPIMSSRLPGMTPVIVTPGHEKYRLTHAEPFRSILAGADASIARAGSYLCIGYGFNDLHLQAKLIERCETSSAPIVVITKELGDNARDFLKGGRCRHYLALEEDPLGTKLFCSRFPEGAVIEGRSLWRLPDFLDLVM
jgi:hypothetical protein